MPTTIYVGTDIGVLRSVDAGASWSVLDDIHFPRVTVSDLVLNEKAGMLVAGTYGRGAFKFAMPTGPVIAVNLEDNLGFGTICKGPAVLTLEVYDVGVADLVINSVQRLMGSTHHFRWSHGVLPRRSHNFHLQRRRLRPPRDQRAVQTQEPSLVTASQLVPGTLHAGSCLNVVIRYKATEKCPRACELIIESDDPVTPVKTLEILAYPIWEPCGCKECCEDCRKGGCDKRHQEPCCRQGYPCCCDDDEDFEDN